MYELFRRTEEYKVASEVEAKDLLENFRTRQSEEGYTLSKSGYEHKEKKSKGEVIEEFWFCKVTLTY